MDEHYLQDLRFFPNTPGQSTGLTPFLNGTIQDTNPFEAQYSAHRSSTSSDVKSENDHISYISIHGVPDHDPVDRAKSSSASSNGVLDNFHMQPMKRHRDDDLLTYENVDNNLPGDSVKRVKFLERNRLAAAKCRTKKKEWTNNLEAAARQASQQTRELQAIVQNLRDEVLNYKTQLMSHQGCECHDIRQYLMNEQAKNFAVYENFQQPRSSSE